jgi:hypothetical protein
MSVQLKKWLPFLTAFVLPIALIYAWWGGFNPVRITDNQIRGPYLYAYLEQKGDYSKLPDLQGKAGKALVDQGIAPGRPITVLYSDPDRVAMGERMSRTGFLLPADVQVRPPLKQDMIAARPVVLAQVQTAIMLAPSRAYQALNDYLKARHETIRMPTVEIYYGASSVFHNGTLSVEMPRAAEPDQAGVGR